MRSKARSPFFPLSSLLSDQASLSKETTNLSQQDSSNNFRELPPLFPSPREDLRISTCQGNQGIPAWHSPVKLSLHQVAKATKSSVYLPGFISSTALPPILCFFHKGAAQETKRRVESLNTAVLTESLHFKSLYKWLFTTLRAPSTLFLSISDIPI